MKNLNVKAFAWLFVFVTVAIWGVALLVSGIELGWTLDALKKLPAVVTIDVILWMLFVKYAWRFPFFQNWLVPFPCLDGTWNGTLQTTWKDPQTGIIQEPIPVVFVIRQSFIAINCVMYSKEMKSQSYAAEFITDPETNSKKIVYTYTSAPRAAIRDRSVVHDGTALLEIITIPERMLRGEYWTNRKTTGEISLKFYKKEFLQTFQDLNNVKQG